MIFNTIMVAIIGIFGTAVVMIQIQTKKSVLISLNKDFSPIKY